MPHSGTPGSKHARCSPGHFAVRRALLRLLAPRHPPAALCSLIIPKRGSLPPRPEGRRGGVRLGSPSASCSNLPPRFPALRPALKTLSSPLPELHGCRPVFPKDYRHAARARKMLSTTHIHSAVFKVSAPRETRVTRKLAVNPGALAGAPENQGAPLPEDRSLP